MNSQPVHRSIIFGLGLNIENFGDGQELPKLPAGVRVTPGAPTSRILARLPCRLVHFNATEHPPAGWTARQLVEACGLEESPRNLILDRDQIYGERFSRQARTLGIREAVITLRSPWQNAYAERVIGSIRRECLDHLVVIGERHLMGILSEYVDYYNRSRTHLSLAEDAPEPRSVQPPSQGRVVEASRVGGLHHEYLRRAA